MRHLLATALLCLFFSSAASAQTVIPRDDRYAHTINSRTYQSVYPGPSMKRRAAHSRRTFHRHARPHHRVHHARRGGGVHVEREMTRGLGARPRAWCGWYMRQVLGVADQAFNLARKWASWGRSAAPAPGVVVVWPHHVGMITGRARDGQWIVKSGNDGHRVRERPRSVARAIAFRAG